MVARPQQQARPSRRPGDGSAGRRQLRRTPLAAVLTLLFSGLAVFGWQPMASADGDETLGPPSIPIAEGSGVATGGTGMHGDQTNTSIKVNVPAGATVKQVLLYWEGHFNTGDPDATIVIAGQTVTGTEIGGPPTLFFGDVKATTYRADITSLDLVSAGANTLPVSGLSFSYRSNGAGLLVIYDDGTDTVIQLRDGSDLAFINFEDPLDTTVPQTFEFAASPVARQATLDLFAASVADDADRPNAVDVTVGGATTRFPNVFFSNAGPEFDVVRLTVTVPAGVTSLTAQALSTEDDDGIEELPASFDWIAATLSIAPPPPPDTPSLSAAVTSACASEGGVKGMIVRLTNDGTAPGTFTVAGIDPVTVGPKSSKDVFLPVAEGAAYSVAITGTGGYQTTLTGTRDCQVPQLGPVEVCVAGVGTRVAVTNSGTEDAPVTLGGETKTVPAGGRVEFVISRAEDAPATTMTATSPGNADLQVALPLQDCVGVSPANVEVAAQVVTTTSTTTSTTIPPEVAGVELARTGFGFGEALRIGLGLVAAGALVAVGARRRRAAG